MREGNSVQNLACLVEGEERGGLRFERRDAK